MIHGQHKSTSIKVAITFDSTGLSVFFKFTTPCETPKKQKDKPYTYTCQYKTPYTLTCQYLQLW
jgi:hypothetical protein